jgi:hypothetical protein
MLTHRPNLLIYTNILSTSPPPISTNNFHHLLKTIQNANRRLYLVGESHLREYLGYLLKKVGDVLEVPAAFKAKYQNMNLNNLIEFKWGAFLRNMMKSVDQTVDYLTTQTSQSNAPSVKAYSFCQENRTFLLQTGTWEDSHWPLSKILEDPMVNDALPRILSYALFGNSCSRQMRFVWLDTMYNTYCMQPSHLAECDSSSSEQKETTSARDDPSYQQAHPVGPTKVIPYDLDCLYFRRKHQQYGTEAINQKYEQIMHQQIAKSLREAIAKEKMSESDQHLMLQDLQQRFRILKLRDIYLPRLLYAETVCGGHFLCQPNAFTLEGTIAADALERVLFNVLDSYMEI